MTKTKLDIAFYHYDRTRALVDGSVKIDGVDASYHSARIVTEIFEAMVARRAYDVSELGFSYFLRSLEVNPEFVAIPVFPLHCFRHSAIYVNKAAGIERPQDLAGKLIGELALYGHDAGIIPKGILSDEYGWKPEQSRWIVGGIDFPMKPIDFVPQPHPANVEVTFAPADADLGKMLEAGEIDALISADTPKCVLEHSPKVGRLFEDYQTVEQDYYRRTGIFPIMHTVVVTRELADKNPDVVKAVYKGFCDAKAAAEQQLVQGMTFTNIQTMVPWLSKLLGENKDLLGDDWWPYGIARNRDAIDVILRYHHEQGITKRRFQVEDIFVPYLLDS